MTKEQALKFIEDNKINLDKYKSVIVTSDNAVYMDSDLEAISTHCEQHNKTYFIVKSEQKELVFNDEVVVEETKPKRVKK